MDSEEFVREDGLDGEKAELVQSLSILRSIIESIADGTLVTNIDGRVFERRSKERSVGRIWSFSDVTADKNAEKALRESYERMSFMVESMPQKAFTARPNGEVDYFNQQCRDFTGLPASQLEGWEWTKIIHPDDAEENVKRWRHSLATGEPFLCEHRFRRVDGSYHWHLSRAQAMHDEQGKVLMWVGSDTDIEGVKQTAEEKRILLESERIARKEVEQASQIKDEFLANLSHELRTPLNAIHGWSQLLLHENKKAEDLQSGLEIIYHNARAQKRLIEDLLDMTSIISGKIRLNIQQLNLARIAETAIASLRPSAENKEIRLQKKLDPVAGPVSGDFDRVQQIVCNLLSNAIKYTPKGGNIMVSVERVASHLELIVSDSGSGINPEFLPFIFMPMNHFQPHLLKFIEINYIRS